jgi:hypothetical protein
MNCSSSVKHVPLHKKSPKKEREQKLKEESNFFFANSPY